MGVANLENTPPGWELGMDRPFCRLILLAVPLALVCLGCQTSSTVSRGQVPDGPKAPTGPLPLLEPLGPAPIEPLTPPPPLIAPALSPTSVAPDGAINTAAAVVQVKVVATIGGEVIITEDEVAMMVRERAMDYIELTGDARTKKEKEVYRDELRKLIERELILHEFITKIKKNKPQVMDELWEKSKQTAERQMKQFRQMVKLDSEEKFTAFLQSKGTEPKLFRRFFERQALTSIFLDSVFKDKQRSVSLSQIDQYYRDHAKEFRVEDRAKWQLLFVSNSRFNSVAESKQYADWLADQVAKGVDFAALAKKYGHGDSALREGEGLGTKRGDFRPAELEETILSLKAGEMSKVIPSANGFQIVKVTEREMAGVKPLDEKLQTAIKNAMLDQSVKVERDKFVAELWRKHTVTVVP